MSVPNERPPYSVAGVAQRLNVTERWVRRAVAEKRIPHYHVGRLLRFDRDAIDAWIAANSVSAKDAT